MHVPQCADTKVTSSGHLPPNYRKQNSDISRVTIYCFSLLISHEPNQATSRFGALVMSGLKLELKRSLKEDKIDENWHCNGAGQQPRCQNTSKRGIGLASWRCNANKWCRIASPSSSLHFVLAPHH
ncbi:hypothetical protein PanWU01x14_154170 [Parasponia andersonii]|uniref:Uncharacterized protein n=1 Tax=Parasponia andersonii TaxID=3476 RepID=A0A2P5CGZ3_PARAD|nr:hypothetical protein PanWU01x14_154170 [Parasponia andersonii]